MKTSLVISTLVLLAFALLATASLTVHNEEHVHADGLKHTHMHTHDEGSIHEGLAHQKELHYHQHDDKPKDEPKKQAQQPQQELTAHNEEHVHADGLKHTHMHTHDEGSIHEGLAHQKETHYHQHDDKPKDEPKKKAQKSQPSQQQSQQQQQQQEQEELSFADIDPYHRYSRVTSLLEHVHATHFESEAAKREEIDKIKTEIMVLGTQLLKEEHRLVALRHERDAQKVSFFWFFDPDTRYQVELAQLRVNDQLRLIEKIAEDIDFHWKQLKPLYGLYSKLFVFELLGFIPDLLTSVTRLFTSSLSMGLLSFLIFGPVAFFLLSFWMNFGIVLLPFVLFGVALYWMFHLPVIMIQYNPTVPQFLSIYLPILTVFLIALRLFVKRRFIKL